MKIGTKSLLFGCHCWFIHPWFVAAAWWKLYGFPKDYRLWIAFLIHDWGYWGKPNIDGVEGESHPEWAAKWMHGHCDEMLDYPGCVYSYLSPKWHDFCLYHSRFYAKRDGVTPSKLCAADKLAAALEPWWFYLPRVILSGEIKEFLKLHTDPTSKYRNDTDRDPNTAHREYKNYRDWHGNMTAFCRKWAYENKDKCR